MENYEKQLLYKLSELDYFEVSEKDPDVRNWDVYTSDGTKVGTVDDLIVDPAALKVRYLDVLIDYTEPGANELVRHILIPIGTASVDADDDKVVLNAIPLNTLRNYPAFEGGIVTRKYEHALRKIIEPDIIYQSDDTGDFYSHTHFDSDMFFSDRRNRRSL
ncbi:MAG: PRC-barrel domain-containing protein [Bacillota bacterium]